MSLRTPTPLTNQQTLLDLNRTKERISVLQDQIATGKRIVRLSDDPSGAALVLDFQTSISQNEAYLKQGTAAGSLLSGAETALSGVNTDIERLLELGQQGLSGTSGANGRAALASEVDGLRSDILSLGNTQVEGKYLFAGTATQTVPFTGPSAGPIVYNGNNGIINLDVSQTFRVATNLPGNTVFFGAGGQGSATDLFQAVTDLRDGLATNNVAQIQTAYNNLQNIHTQLNQNITDLGGRQSALDQVQSTLGDVNLNLQSVLNSAQQLDYPAAITEFSNQQTTQQATLSTLSKVNQQNLFDFLG